MKISTVVLLLALVALQGCDWIRDLGKVNFDTDLVVNVPINSDMKKSVATDESVADYNFFGSAVLSLAENEDIEPYMEKLREINLQSLEVTIIGLLPTQTIITMSLSVSGVGTLCTQTNITSINNTFTPEIDANLLEEAGQKLVDDGLVTVTISGTATGPVANTVTLVFKSKVTAGALD
ncbi:MAG TPA: hypothetical protein PKJ71_11230 [Bacteroidales bacterium]|jgi:hypothetical protein|nr:hypothetical protein [Bacteroidales bacterium]HNT94255.1 hypothetical protein [Bacteroidales bacterium]HOO67441.1 hypothetical protein [Bacteroidales bacterium]HRW27846.1 hypothetical protein [Bacteroidales bacterium]